MKSSKEFAQHYASGKYPQPITVLSEVPGNDYYLAWARYIYSMYCGGVAYTHPPALFKKTDIATLRAYARGEQPTSKYQKMIDVCVKDGKVGSTALESGSLLNISMDNIRYYPKYRDLCITNVSGNEWEPVVRAMNSEASFDRMKQFFIGKLSTDPRMGELFQQAGVTPPSAQKYSGMTSQDVDTTSQMGGIQLAAESLMADVIGTTMDISEWDMLKNMLVSDIVDANFAGLRVCCTNGGLKLEYCDIEGLIFPASKYHDHRDDQYVASLRRTTIATLRVEFGIPEKELFMIAKSYGGMHNNNARAYSGFNQRSWREDYAASNGYQVYDHFTVEVMDFHFICSQAESSLVGIYQDPKAESRVDTIGGTAYKEDKFATQYVHSGCWVVGSDIVLGCCKDSAQVREGDNGQMCARLPIRIWSGDGPSITERCLSVIDDIQMAVLKVRLLIANLPPGPRFMMDMSVLENAVQFGKDSYDMRDMLTIFGATGKLLIRSKSEFDGNYGASNKNPIIPIESGIQEDFSILANQMAMGLDMIRQSTGINEIADGTGTPGDVLNGVAKGFQAASNNALKPMILGLQSLHVQAFNTIAKKYQSLRLHGDVEVKKWSIDASHFTVLALPSELPVYDFVIKARLLPSQDEIQMVMQSLLQKTQEGVVNGADALIVMQMIRDRDVIKAQLYLGKAVEASKQREQQRQAQLIQEQAKANEQSAIASENARMKTMLAEKEADTKMLEAHDFWDAKKAERDHEHKMEEIEAKGKAESGREVVKNMAVSENVGEED
jgi:hypothetical protein